MTVSSIVWPIIIRILVMYNNIYNDSYDNCDKNSLVNVIFMTNNFYIFFMYNISNIISWKKICETTHGQDKTSRKIEPDYLQ